MLKALVACVIFLMITSVSSTSISNINTKSEEIPYQRQASQTELEIKIDIFCVTVENIGDEIATNVVVDMLLTGDILLAGQTSSSGIITSIAAGDTSEMCINPGFMLGLGEVTLSASAIADNAPEVQKSKVVGRLMGTLFIPYNDEVIEVITDREEYGISEPVTVIVTNVGETKIEIGGPCFYFYNYQGELVWEGCFYCYWELEPGEYETMIWDQKNMQGEQVPGGTYKVKGEFNIDDKLYSDTSTFYILESGRFCGYVYAPDGQTPLEKAVIYVDAVDCFWETDENGHYETGNHWMPGWWDITACPPHEHPEALMCSFKIAHIERGETCWVNFTLENKKENNPPQNMEINGPTSCKIGTEYEYIFTAKDPENDQIYFSVYWDDGNLPSFYTADDEGKIKIKKTWDKQGDFKVTSYTVDKYAYGSEIATLDISVTKSRQTNALFEKNQFISRLLKKH